MAVAYDNSKVVLGSNVQTVTTAAFTIAANAQGAVGFFRYNAVTAISLSLSGVSGTELAASHAINAGNGEEASWWSVINPPSGSKTATASWTTNAFCTLAPVTATGVDSTTPLNNGNATNTAANPDSVTITSVSGDLTLSMVGTTGPTTTTTCNQTKRQSGYGSIATGAGAGTDTHTWTGTDADLVAGANFKAAAAGAAFLAEPNPPILQAVKRAAYW